MKPDSTDRVGNRPSGERIVRMVFKVDVPVSMIHGDVDEGYGKVADAFRANFAAGTEVGAAVCVYRDGVKVVDLWGGYRDGVTKAPWQADTIVTFFSTTKGIAALAVALAVSRGLINYDAKVADYWPAFSQHGKAEVTVRQLTSHQAGLPAPKPTPALRDVADTERLSAILAAQRPAWVPGTRFGYHGVTLGWYESELIRHTDPAGRTLGRFLGAEIAEPMDLDLHIGLPESVDRNRVARVHGFRPPEFLLHLNEVPPRFALALLNPRSLSSRTFMIPSDVGELERIANTEEARVVEMPASNGIGSARAVAKAYGSAATGGAQIGLTPTTFEALTEPAVVPSGGRRDKVLYLDSSFSLGFWKPFRDFWFGSSEKAFGTPGAGGSFGFADPDTGIGFGYVMNRLGFRVHSDPRELAIRQMLFRDVLGARPQT